MAGPHGSDPDDWTAAGSDGYGPGGRLGPGDLAPDEERLLAALERDARGLPEIPVRDTILDVRTHRADVPGDPDDGLTPLFAAPDLDD
ncbi:hypothetical protein DQ239_16295 [Blastococcus sp. TF02-09]|nr:hypothetical protein DQ239_16295 [Blastococcus sp. TF02-9]